MGLLNQLFGGFLVFHLVYAENLHVNIKQVASGCCNDADVPTTAPTPEFISLTGSMNIYGLYTGAKTFDDAAQSGVCQWGIAGASSPNDPPLQMALLNDYNIEKAWMDLSADGAGSFGLYNQPGLAMNTDTTNGECFAFVAADGTYVDEDCNTPLPIFCSTE